MLVNSSADTADPSTFIHVPEGSHFPLCNLPWGVFERNDSAEVLGGLPQRHAGVAIGDSILDVTALEAAGYLEEITDNKMFQQGTLNGYMAAGQTTWRAVRACLTRLLGSGGGQLRDAPVHEQQRYILPQASASMHLPCTIGDYTDFYCSRQHAFNVGCMFRGPENALNPNWLQLPVGYHGRASSIVTSGTAVRRPWGQLPPAAGCSSARFLASRAVDFELEVAAFIGPGNELGTPIPIHRAHEHLFGLVLMNDWSARDVQKWEYIPLGPFNGKNWATQISPWIITMDALRYAACEPLPQDPPPLDYLDTRRAGSSMVHITDRPAAAATAESSGGAYDVDLSVDITPAGHERSTTVTRSNLKHLYWTFIQMVAHHTAGGCNLRPGDLLGSGTISGDGSRAQGCLLELTAGGQQPLWLDVNQAEDEEAAGEEGAGAHADVEMSCLHGEGRGGGMDASAVAQEPSAPLGSSGGDGCAGGGGPRGKVSRTYLQDYDAVVLRGTCMGAGGMHMGFGECHGVLLPALSPDAFK